MKNSAWYHQLWLTKLSDLPVKEDADTAWTGMEQILDQQLPIGNSSSGTAAPKPVRTSVPKPTGTSLSTYFGYIISAAAMVGVTAYFTLRTPEQAKVKAVYDKNNIQTITDTLRSDTLVAETHLPDSARIAPFISTSVADTHEVNTKQPNNVVANTHIQGNQTIVPTPVPATPVPSSSPADTTPAKTNANTLSMKIGTQFPARQLPADNADSTPQQEKQRQKRQKRSLNAKAPIDTPPYNYGLEAGISNANDKNTFYIGAFGTYALSPRWLIRTGLRMNTPRAFTGHYTLESYFRPDSTPAFSFTDKRKVLTMDIPVAMTYKLSNTLSIHGGPVISLPLKQSGIKLGPIDLKTDTLMHTKTVYAILNSTKMNRINVGFSTGISLHLSQFDINARYQVLSPYSFSNEFGDNKFKYRNFQIGIGYRFK